MNYRFVVNQLGLLLVVLSGVMLVLACWESADVWLSERGVAEEGAARALLVTVGLGLVSGGLLWFIGRSAAGDTFSRREAILLVALSWLVGAALAAMPYYLWTKIHQPPAEQPFHRYVACYFEAMSGLTTTGASVLSDIESLPRGLLLWRATTHWLGGLGIVVLFVAVLPSLGVGGKKIFHVEAPGPTHAGVKPRIRHTARILWLIYTGLTVAQIIAYCLCGMSVFDSVCHTFATLATGGFSTKNASIGAYGSSVLWITMVFMVLAGGNFGLYYQAFRGDLRSVLRDTELRFYLALLLAGTAVMALVLIGHHAPLVATTGQTIPTTPTTAIEHTAFTAVSIMTTTGFATVDYERWPNLANAVVILFMFIGGCAGSTAGGVKVVRLWIALKIILAEIERVFHPNVVRPVRLNQTSLDPDLRTGVLVYALGLLLLAGVGIVAVMALELNHPQCDFTTAATASLTTLGNVGPGLGAIGPVDNYGWMNDSTIALLSLWMALGRLEVFTIAVLFMPKFWKGN